MPDFIVTTAFRAKDGVTPELKGMGNAAKGFGNKATSAFKRASKGALSFKKLVGADLLGRAISRTSIFAQSAIRSVADEYIDFDSSIGKAAAKFPQKIKRGTDAFKELEDAARQLGATTEFTAAQAAQGLEEYAKAGIDSASAMGLLAGTAELATNAGIELGQAADFSLTALDAFGMRSKNAAETVANLARVNDTLTAVVTSAKLDMEDFNETLKFTGPVAADVGASLEDMAAVTGLVAKAGIKGSLAGTALKNMYLGLAKQTPKATKVLKDLGVDAVDPLTGDVRDALSVLQDFARATEDMGNAQRLAAIDTVFGRRSISAVSKVMALGSDEIDNYRKSLDEAKGSSSEMAGEIRKSLENKLKTLKSAAIELGFKFLEAFKEDGKSGIETLTAAIRKFDAKPIIEGMKQALKIIKEVFNFIKENPGTTKAILGSLAALKLGGAAGITGALGGGGGGGMLGGAGGGVAGIAAAGVAGAGAKGLAGLATAAGTAGAALMGAAAAGGLLGTAFSQLVLDPMFQESIRSQTNAGNKLAKTELALVNSQNLSLQEMQKLGIGLQESKTSLLGWMPSMEEAFEQIGSTLTGTKGPMDEWREKLERQAAAQAALVAAIQKARARLEGAGAGASTVNIDANIANAPAGSTVDVSTSPGAPPVNVNQTGKS
jgi:TP901 family phage tail tape measure protein